MIRALLFTGWIIGTGLHVLADLPARNAATLEQAGYLGAAE